MEVTVLDLQSIPSDGAALVGPFRPRRGTRAPKSWRAFLYQTATFLNPGLDYQLVNVTVAFMTVARWKYIGFGEDPGWKTWNIGPFIVGLRLRFDPCRPAQPKG